MKAKAKNTTTPFIDPSKLKEDLFGTTCRGACMHPEVPDGSNIVVDRKTRPVAGDLVCLFFKPEFVKAGELQTWVKRLVTGVPPWVKEFPYRDHPESTVKAIILVESINPRRQYVIECDKLLGLYKASLPQEGMTFHKSKLFHDAAIKTVPATRKRRVA